MDSLITAAGRALATGDPLNALNLIALRDDAPALALRGIAMAQLGDLARAKLLLRRAARAFGTKETVARARCAVAEAEIALVSRELNWPVKALDAARATLERQGDHANAAHARYLAIRRLILIGRIDDAEKLLAGFDPTPLPPALRAAHELVIAGIALRRLRTKPARTALAQARRAARQACIPSLMAEVESAALVLTMPAARLIAHGHETSLRLDEVEALLGSEALVIDACHHAVSFGGKTISLKTRPVLFALARILAEAWPSGASREKLLAHAFRARHADESHRARLRVEIGRLRKTMRDVADIGATKDGFTFVPHHTREVVVLAPPTDDDHATVLSLLSDGEAWSSSALALAIGASQRTVQRALDDLAASGKVRSVGRARARRWITPPLPGYPTSLLLTAALPGG
jgi:hypothetical protein